MSTKKRVVHRDGPSKVEKRPPAQRARTADELDQLTLEAAAAELVKLATQRGVKLPTIASAPLVWRTTLRASFDLDGRRDDEAREVLAQVLADLERPSFKQARTLAYELARQKRLGPNARRLIGVAEALEDLARADPPDRDHERRRVLECLRRDLSWRWLDGSAKEYALVGIVAGTARYAIASRIGRARREAREAPKGKPAPPTLWPSAGDAISDERREFARLLRKLK